MPRFFPRFIPVAVYLVGTILVCSIFIDWRPQPRIPGIVHAQSNPSASTGTVITPVMGDFYPVPICAVQAEQYRTANRDNLCVISGLVVSPVTGGPITVRAACASADWADAQKIKTNCVPFTAQQVVRLYRVSSEGQKLIQESRESIARSADGSLCVRESPVASAFWTSGTLIDAHTGKAYRLDFEHQCATLLHRASFVAPPLQPPTGEEHGISAGENSLGTRIIGGIPCIGFKYRARSLTRRDGSQVSSLDGTVGKETWEIWVAPSLNYQVLEETRPVLPYIEDIKPFVPGVEKNAGEFLSHQEANPGNHPARQRA